ncbi:multiubiquitin domain-containing protein [Sphingomonas sp. MMS24-JH45]
MGRQILEAAGLDPERGYSIFAILDTGDFEDVRLNETFDLRGAGAERMSVAFLTDRDFKFEVNDHEERWGKPTISGRILEQLAKPGPDEAVFLVRGGTDIPDRARDAGRSQHAGDRALLQREAPDGGDRDYRQHPSRVRGRR